MLTCQSSEETFFVFIHCDLTHDHICLVTTPGEGTTLGSGAYQKLAMDGREVYRVATREVARVLKEAIDAADLMVDNVDWLFMLLLHLRFEGISVFSRSENKET